MPGEAPFFVGHRLVSDALATISSALSTSPDSPFMAANRLGKTAHSLEPAKQAIIDPSNSLFEAYRRITDDFRRRSG
jgi:hypothetical protein